LFLEDFGDPRNVFFILADGTEGEIFFFGEGELDRIDAGRIRSLVDERGILPSTEFPEPRPDPADQLEELRRALTWFWHDLSHFTAAIGRGQLWWAVGQLEILRACCVNLVRIEQGVEAHDEPYEKLDSEISPGELEPLRSTFMRWSAQRCWKPPTGSWTSIAPSHPTSPRRMVSPIRPSSTG
jgi:hypothetical protein